MSQPDQPLSLCPQQRWMERLASVGQHTAPIADWRRDEKRYAVAAVHAQVIFEPAGGNPEDPVQMRASVLDVSEAGLGLLVRQRVAADTELAMRLHFFGQDEPEVLLLGRVVHCTESLGGYRLGVQLIFFE